MSDLDSAQAALEIKAPAEVKLMAGDLIEIHISSISQETNSYFVKPGSDGNSGANTYLIHADGKVDLPLIGRVELADKTSAEAEEQLRELLLEYLQKPVVNVRLANFSITVLGEVKNPGVYQVPAASATIFEALGLAGDMTIYGERSNVLLVRNYGDDKQHFRVDLTKSSVFKTEGFHLQNNDLIYIPPSRGRASADDNVYRLLPLIISGLTFVVVLVSLSQ